MNIVTVEEMLESERKAIADGHSAAALMDEAGLGLARAICRFFPSPGKLIIFCGKGNNAGDALVAGRHLRMAGWRVETRCAFPPEEMAPLPRRHLDALNTLSLSQPANLLAGPLVVLDGLLGIGAAGEPRPPVEECIKQIRRLRATSGAFVVAVDTPSGLVLANGTPGPLCVRADCTVTFGACKEGLLSDAATGFVGRIEIVELTGLRFANNDDRQALTPKLLGNWLPVRNFDSYKGTYGHVGIVAGAIGYLGAAKLCALGALHGGAGLVSLFAKREVYPFLSPILPPEVMLHPVADFRAVLSTEFDALVLGPGLVGEPPIEIMEIIRMAEVPTVIDAAAISHLAAHLKTFRLSNGPRILTPHPGEMDRIYRGGGRPRDILARDFVSEFPCALLLKGARTLIAAPGRPLLYNTTGTPGMGTGGMGDVLAGLIGALCAEGIRPQRAAALGSWINGRAAEIAVASGFSVESLSASVNTTFFGTAFSELRSCFPDSTPATTPSESPQLPS